MPKEIFDFLGKKEKRQKSEEKPEPIFATQEELAEKEQLFKALKEVKDDKSVESLTKQKEIYTKLLELDERRKERIAHESGEEVYDAEKGIFTNIRFKPGIDRSGMTTNYISRHAGRPLVVLESTAPEVGIVVPNKPYKARAIKISPKGIIYVRIIE